MVEIATEVLHQARLGDGSLVDLEIEGGKVVKVVPCGGSRCDANRPGATDIGTRLVLPAPAEPHAHLDKALLADRFPYSGGDLDRAISDIRAAYDHLDADDLYDRARRAAREAVRHGCTVIRSHVDTGGSIGTRGVEALISLRQELVDTVDIRVTAMVSPDVTGTDGRDNRRTAERAIALGVDALGGCPTLEADPAVSVHWFVTTAAAAGLPLDLHVDETTDSQARSLVLLAREVIDTGFPHLVSASHCVSLGVQDPAERAEVIELVRRAAISVIACPQTNLLLQGRGEVPGLRGIAPVATLRVAGVLTAGGGDNWRDPFNPLGRIDPLETAALLVSAAHIAPEAAYAAVSSDARAVIGVPVAGPVTGAAADLLIVPARDVAELVASGSPDRVVLRAGRLVARTETAAWTAIDSGDRSRSSA